MPSDALHPVCLPAAFLLLASFWLGRLFFFFKVSFVLANSVMSHAQPPCSPNESCMASGSAFEPHFSDFDFRFLALPSGRLSCII